MRQAAHWERRIPIYLIGMFLMTIGVNLSVLSGLGVSPIDTIPYILSLILQKSLGLCSTLVFSVYIVFWGQHYSTMCAVRLFFRIFSERKTGFRIFFP